jgi:MFS transporter, DHA2 family, multidrug resistance protein
MASTCSPSPPPRLTEGGAGQLPRSGAVLGALSLTFACVALDNTKLVLAVPTLAREFGADAAGAALTWIVEVNLVVYASLLLLGGALSERFGPRRLLLVGLWCFIAGSAAAACAASAFGLCAARALSGLGAALMVPASLAAVQHLFGERERARAVSIWTASFAAAGALGPVLGGLLLERWGWRASLLGNVPFALLAVAGVVELVPAALPRRAAPLDLCGTALGFGATLCLLGGLLGGDRGTSLIALGAAATLTVSLVVWQQRAPHPMLEPQLFRRPAFRLTLLAILLAYLAFSGTSFAVAQYLQVVRAHAPSHASWLNLPLPLAMLLGTLSAPRLSRRLGSGRALGASLALALGGAVLVAGACWIESDLGLCAALVPFAAGAGSAFPNATQIVLGAVPPERAGSAAAISETAFELGGVLGIALLGSRVGALPGNGGNGATLAVAGAAVALAAAWWIGGRSIRELPSVVEPV